MITIADYLAALKAQPSPPPAGPPQRLWQNPRPYPSAAGGRPRKLDQQAKELVCCLVNKGHTLSEAAAFVACDRNTILNERKRDPQFDANVKRARRMRMVDPLDAIARASRTSWRAAAWLADFHRRTESEARERRLRRREAKARLAQQKEEGSFLAPTPDAPPACAPADAPAPPQVAADQQVPAKRSARVTPHRMPKNRLTKRPRHRSRRGGAARRHRRRLARAAVKPALAHAMVSTTQSRYNRLRRFTLVKPKNSW
jgi:hypothetical protein